MGDAPARPGPWTGEDAIRWAVMFFIAGVILLVAWWQVSGEGFLTRQVQWVNFAVAGLVVGLYAHVAWILRGRRAVGERRRALLGEPPPLTAPVRPELEGNGHGMLVAVPGLRRYHRVGCPLVSGRTWERQSRTAHERAGRVACGVCLGAKHQETIDGTLGSGPGGNGVHA